MGGGGKIKIEVKSKPLLNHTSILGSRYCKKDRIAQSEMASVKVKQLVNFKRSPFFGRVELETNILSIPMP